MQKIIFFPEGTLIAKALVSALFATRCCYAAAVFLSTFSLNTAFVSAYNTSNFTKRFLNVVF